MMMPYLRSHRHTRPSSPPLSNHDIITGCTSAERLSRIGQPPALSAVSNPTQERDYRPVTMPMPTPIALEPAANSLWRPGARAFFKDQRAKEVGDVMTVVVNIQNERAQLSNETRRTRDNTSESLSVPNFFNQKTQIGQTETHTAKLFGNGHTKQTSAGQLLP